MYNNYNSSRCEIAAEVAVLVILYPKMDGNLSTFAQ